MELTIYDKQLFRRVFASLIDFILVISISFLVFTIFFIINFLTFNLFKTAYLFMFPVIFICYYSLTLGSDKSSTIGMKLLDFQLKPKTGRILGKRSALIHTLTFYLALPVGVITLTYLIYPILNDKRTCMHDLIYKVKFLERRVDQ